MGSEQERERAEALEARLGHAFARRELLETALTRPSYRAERLSEGVADNQRLEFLGDAVLGLLAAQEVYARHPDAGEGVLTVQRSRLASGRALAGLARRLGLGGHLRLGRADEAAGGRDTERALADALEAVLGAVWCDGGLEAARAVFGRLLALRDEEQAPDAWDENPKGALQEWAQRRGWPDSPAYALVGAEGPDHAPVYTVRAALADGRGATGSGATKRAAEAEAARALLAQLKAAGET